MTLNLRRQTILLGVVSTLAFASPARAQESVAEQLFLEGRALMQAKDYEKACAKFKAAHDIDRTAVGTLLNLALCHEQLGKVASAWAEFRQVAAESAGKREDRVTMSREHEAKLRPLLSYLTVIVPAQSRAPGLTVKLDQDTTIAETVWGTPIPIDPGKHLIEGTAPGRVTSREEIVIEQAPGSNKQITIPVLGIAETPVDTYAEDLAKERRKRRIVGYVLGGIGVAAMGAGAIFGVRALDKNGEANEVANGCVDGRVCDTKEIADDGNRKDSEAKTSATVSTVLFGGGILLLGVGAVVVLTARPPPITARITPNIGIGSAGLTYSGAF